MDIHRANKLFLSQEYEKEKDNHLAEQYHPLFPSHLASRPTLSNIC